MLSAAALASPDHLVLKQGEQARSLAIDDLRERADQHFRFFDPYEAEEVEVRGLVFRELLEAEYGEVPQRLTFTAWDDYEVTLGGWDDPNWILVTHQNGEALGLRDRGPLRLVERDYGDRDPENLRNFNDWVWMIRSIEAVP
ncbi:hypothetical protein QC758_11390 [Halomonas campisalis]|uniref:hypothetical protein n=1 Tax=Billgrantia campisalis TaxID=74661 RepID=UPI001EF15B8D|nr:hypothetical protein [Halomonas campisalis]MDR5863564.1 hypothetical protein [Halomonas campisalis]